jgi:hypothetical protein
VNIPPPAFSPKVKKLALATAVSLLLLAGCGNPGTSGPHVPKLVGLQKRAAETALAKKGLRWRYGTDGDIESVAPRSNVFTSQDSDRVVKQSPAPGAAVKAGAVITLVTHCMVHGPCM